MGGFGHVAVVEAVQFVEGDVLVAVEAEHADEVGVFLVASEEFHLAVSGDDEHRCGVSAYIIEGRKVVDRRSEVTVAQQCFRDMPPVACEASAVEPHDDRTAFRALFIRHIEAAHLFGIGVRRALIQYIGLAHMIAGPQSESRTKQQRQCQESFPLSEYFYVYKLKSDSQDYACVNLEGSGDLLSLLVCRILPAIDYF